MKSTKELRETLGGVGYAHLDCGDGIGVHTYVQTRQIVLVKHVQFFM